MSFRPNALVLFNPAVDLTPEKIGLKSQTSMRREQAERMGAPIEKLSLLNHVRPDLPPTIIFHGTGDKTIPFETVQAFTKAMHASNNRCELIPFEGENHGFFNFGPNDNRYYHETVSHMDRFLSTLGYQNRDSNRAEPTISGKDKQ